MTPARVIQPGGTLGVLGSGQLGRMFAIAARRLGYRVHVLSPDDDTPTGQVDSTRLDSSAVRNGSSDTPTSNWAGSRCPPSTWWPQCFAWCDRR